MVYRIEPPQRAYDIARRRILIGVTSLNSVSCLGMNVPAVMAAVILTERASPLADFNENYPEN